MPRRSRAPPHEAGGPDSDRETSFSSLTRSWGSAAYRRLGLAASGDRNSGRHTLTYPFLEPFLFTARSQIRK